MSLPSNKTKLFDATMKEIQVLLAAEMAALSEQIETLFQHECRWIQQVAQYSFQAPGKQVRPILVFLVAGACGGITPKTQRGAMLILLLHQTSLVHDDVVDEATHRRGRPAINAVWGNKVAVLFGDYLLATSLRLATQHQDHDFLALISETAQAMSAGELRQLAQARSFDTTEEIYLAIIHKKTAHLFGTCLAVGAIAAGASVVQVATLRQVGEHIGMAFQLKDDWLDYGTEDLGKPLGMDLKEGQLTLPLINALQQASAQQKKEILHIFKHSRHHPQQKEEVLAFVRQSPGMDYTQKMMLQYQKKALQTLANTAASPYQEALCTLIQHI
jgi:octaprenyl-diphosphate synthase